jgi:pentatricopeptide repeat protein
MATVANARCLSARWATRIHRYTTTTTTTLHTSYGDRQLLEFPLDASKRVAVIVSQSRSFSSSTTSPKPTVSSGISKENLVGKTQKLIHAQLGSWTAQELSQARFLMEAWSRRLDPSNPEQRSLWTSRILRRWVEERLSDSSTGITKPTSGEIVEMLHRVFHSWRLLEENGGEVAVTERVDLLNLVEEASRLTNDPALIPGNKAYSMVIYALANLASCTSTCEEAETLLMRRLEQTEAPDVQLFNSCLHVYAKCSPYNDAAPDRAEALLQQMMTKYRVQPDTSSFSSVLHAWAGSPKPAAAERAEAILEHMISVSDDEEVQVNATCFNVCIDAWAKAKRPQKAESLLRRMFQLHRQQDQGHHFHSIQPNSISFNSAINAWSKSREPKAAQNAERLLQQMTTHDISPTHESFTAVLEAWSHIPDSGGKVQAMLEHLETRHAQGQDAVRTSKISYLCAIRAWGNTRLARAPEKAQSILRRLQSMSEVSGQSELTPCVVIYSAVIDCWSKSRRREAPDRALKLLREMQALSDLGHTEVSPNSITFNSVISSFASQGRVDEAQSLLDEMKQGDATTRPDVISYSTVIHACSKSRQRHACERASELLNEMISLSNQGHVEVKPTARTYASVILAWGSSRHPDGAKQAHAIFENMLALYELGDQGCRPDTIIINCVLRAWSRSTEGGAYQKPEALFEWMQQEVSKGNMHVQPDSTTYFHLISAWAKSGRSNGPQKAEEYLSRCKELAANDDSKTKLNASHFNAVLLAWANSGHPSAVTFAESLVQEMYSGIQDVTPDVITWNTFLKAIVASNLDDRLERANAAVSQMKEHGVQPDGITHNMIRRCSSRR